MENLQKSLTINGELLNKLIERIPDFNMRLKVNPKTNHIEFSADVNPVFDIAWFTLARMISEDLALENKGQPDDHMLPPLWRLP